MSTDFAFWKRIAGDPGDIFDDLAEGNTDAVESHADVRRFRADLLTRWPDLIDNLEPGALDLEEDPADEAKYVLLTLPLRMLAHLDDILDLAKAYGLSGYSGVAGEAF